MDNERPLILIELDEVKAKIGARSDDTVYNYIKTKGFPKPVKRGRRFSRWVSYEVDDWIRNMIDERDRNK